MEIKIGADELILWLRKNKKAEDKTTTQLGLEILKLVESVGGKLTNHDVPSFWDTDANLKSIDEYKLPKTSSQYLLDSSKLEDLYIALFNW